MPHLISSVIFIPEERLLESESDSSSSSPSDSGDASDDAASEPTSASLSLKLSRQQGRNHATSPDGDEEEEDVATVKSS